MRKLVAITIAFTLTTALVRGQTPTGADEDDTVRFVAYDVDIDTGNTPLAAYQIEINDPSGRSVIVGVEGGESAAFATPPYYDPKALHNEGRIILGAFTTKGDGPTGTSRVARLHMQVSGEQPVDFDVKVIVAADADGHEIDADVTISEGNQ